MKTRRIFAVAVVALAVILPAGTAPAEAPVTATVDVMLEILPYVEVTLDQVSVEIEIPAGATYFGPVYVGGTVVSNCSTMLFARITKPDLAPGVWVAAPASLVIPEGGVHYDEHLLQIMVYDIPAGFTGWTWTVDLSGKSAATPGDVETPPAGWATITVVPG